MATQTATSGQLENAQNITIGAVRHTMENATPNRNLIEHFTLADGEKSMTIPKVGQVDAEDLTDGQDMTTNQEIGMTTTSLTTAEVGLKFILTDKLVRQSAPSVFAMVGRQAGDAMSRKEDNDIIALYTALNGGTDLGVDTVNLKPVNLGGCIAHAKDNNFPRPIAVVHNPNAVYYLTSQLSVSPGTTYPIPNGFAMDLLKDFWAITISGVGVFQDGNIALNTATSGYGAIFSKSAMCIITSKAPSTERERDASLRATELVTVSDYGVFELDDGYGAPMLYKIGAPITSA